jgi:CubicO group peptidase (beta-lactamase class C family)
MSDRAFGHTGFTGTSIWIDPARDVFVILLSNRVNPTRANTKIGRVRVALADAVMSTLTRSPLSTQSAHP